MGKRPPNADEVRRARANREDAQDADRLAKAHGEMDDAEHREVADAVVRSVNSMNERVADALIELAILAGLAGDNPYKVSSYERAANTIRDMPTNIIKVPLRNIPGVGESIAKKVRSIMRSGTCPRLEHLRKLFPPDGEVASQQSVE